MFKLNSVFNADGYKPSHFLFMPKATATAVNKVTKMFGNMTPRADKYFRNDYPDFDGLIVVFGLQFVIKNILIDHWNENFFDVPFHTAIKEISRLFSAYMGETDITHWKALHGLGYLPVEVKALLEGTLAPVKIPHYTIQETNEDFAWVASFLETIMSDDYWKQTTVATVAREFRRLVNANALDTTGSLVGTEFQLHDFSMRGQAIHQSAHATGAAFLTSTCGTDTIGALPWLEYFYGVDFEKEFIAATIPATEHSITCLNAALIGEAAFIKRAITEDVPNGMVGIVGDTYNWWNFIDVIIRDLKPEILARPVNPLGLSKVVVRPDSGDPADIICGQYFEDLTHITKRYAPEDAEEFSEYCEDLCADRLRDRVQQETPHGECGDDEPSEIYKIGDKHYKITLNIEWNRYDKQYYFIDGCSVKSFEEIELTLEQKGSIEILWEIFGGTVSEQGYKVLDSHIGLIYGDSITYKRAKDIFARLKAKGFATTNVVFGVGSYSLSSGISRDTLGMAVKSTGAIVDGNLVEMFKDPVTDDGTKKSAKGLLRVERDESGKLVLFDQQTEEQEKQGLLVSVFKDGELLVDQKFSDIRNRIWS